MRFRVPLTRTNSGTFCWPSLRFFSSSSYCNTGNICWGILLNEIICRFLRHTCPKSSKVMTYFVCPKRFSIFFHDYSQLVSSASLCVASPPSQREDGVPAPSACAALSFCCPAHTAAPAYFWAVDPWENMKKYWWLAGSLEEGKTPNYHKTSYTCVQPINIIHKLCCERFFAFPTKVPTTFNLGSHFSRSQRFL